MRKVHKNIYIEETDQDLTALGGVTAFDYLYTLLDIPKRVSPCLPTQKMTGVKDSNGRRQRSTPNPSPL